MADFIPNSAIRIPTSINGSFFRHWFEFLSPFHKLSSKEMDVIATILKRRYELSKVISDSDILDKVTMSNDNKKKIREECNISVAHFQVILSKLRKSKVLLENKVNPRYIPVLPKDIENSTDKKFKLLLVFEFNDNI